MNGIPEIAKKSFLKFAQNWGMGRVKDTKFGMNVSNGSYLMLENQKVTVFIVFELFGKKKTAEEGGGKSSPTNTTQIRLKKILQQCNDFFINLCLQVSQGKHFIVKYSQILKNSEHCMYLERNYV